MTHFRGPLRSESCCMSSPKTHRFAAKKQSINTALSTLPNLHGPISSKPFARRSSFNPAPIRRISSYAASSSSAQATNPSQNKSISDEVQAAVNMAVHEAMEAETKLVQDTVVEAVEQALKDENMGFNLRANVNTFVFLMGVIVFERGVWAGCDEIFGNDVTGDLASLLVGLFIIVSVRVFNIPLAEWRRPGE